MNEGAQKLARLAVDRGCHFLVGAQESDGFWRDYTLAPGASSEWITAVVGYTLSGIRYPFARPDESLTRALGAMRACCRPSGWGYNASVATDADTTSWALRWFAQAHTAPPIEPISCLSLYIGPRGGARTFAADARYGRWTLEHPDVTAVVGVAMRESGVEIADLERMREWALGQRTTEGLWTAFWWTFDAYATARMLEFLAITGGIAADVVETSRLYLETKIPGATPMETANLLMIATQLGVVPDAWLSALLDQQCADGGWPPSRVLKVPDQRTGHAGSEAFGDMHRLMSTAMALMALTALLEKGF